ncbi:twin-arginine translocase TatA/TatE family subunit [candidate division WOR-3 bacterium]|nr:twin-arginine translocase TatA/TatE family subunit [candidate division WOR-3 bacterium]
MFGVGWQEILLIVLIVLLLFGAKRIPEVMRSIGRGMRELKQGMKDIDTNEPEKDHKEDQGPKAD